MTRKQTCTFSREKRCSRSRAAPLGALAERTITETVGEPDQLAAAST
jgi:hypothetical protein